MTADNDLLIMSAARLYSLGVDVEGARAKLKELVDKRVPYDSPEMLTALKDFQELDAQFKSLETDHIELRDDIRRKGCVAN